MRLESGRFCWTALGASGVLAVGASPSVRGFT